MSSTSDSACVPAGGSPSMTMTRSSAGSALRTASTLRHISRSEQTTIFAPASPMM